MSIKLELDDSRRLTGKNLIWDYPGAIIDVFISGIEPHQVVDCFKDSLAFILERIGWTQSHFHYRLFEGGASFVISAPMDALYAATEVNEAVWLQVCEHFLQQVPDETLEQACERIIAAIEEESNPLLMNFLKQSSEHQIPFLVDDDELTLGFGKHSQTWPVRSLPDINKIDWQQFKGLPIAMVTGTNGKSTTVRLAAEMVMQDHLICGVTSTDFIRVGSQILDEGDYSGPLGARTLLKHPDTEVALLEVARGGLLRRGLAVDKIDAALITNIASDHLGQYGIYDLEGLTQTKGIVAKGLDNGPLILNADDEQLVHFAKFCDKQIIWFSIDSQHLLIKQQIEQGKICAFLEQGKLIYHDGIAKEILAVDDIPMTLSGAAHHNVKNALGAICLARALNVSWNAIRQALKTFKSDASDNPGRGNQFHIKDATLLVDFAHNAHSMAAMAETAANLSADKKILLMSSAGDRSDEDIIAMTKAALKMNPNCIYFAEVEKYLRGRALGEVTELMKKTAQKCGYTSEQIIQVSSPILGTQQIVSKLQGCELVLIMALTQREKIFQYLQNSL